MTNDARTRPGYFGRFGGRYVAATLLNALEELDAAFNEAMADPAFHTEYHALLRDYAGRPSPLYLARRLSERVGCKVYLKREDLNHTGAHKINNTIGQGLLARRMSKQRIIAETGAGQHGVATATVAAARAPLPGVHGRRGRAPPGPQRLPHEASGRGGRAGGGSAGHPQGRLR